LMCRVANGFDDKSECNKIISYSYKSCILYIIECDASRFDRYRCNMRGFSRIFYSRDKFHSLKDLK
jgi:hypothetical protein